MSASISSYMYVYSTRHENYKNRFFKIHFGKLVMGWGIEHCGYKPKTNGSNPIQKTNTATKGKPLGRRWFYH